MKPQYEDFYSNRAQKMRASEIRELLKLTQKPEIISFAGGLPNPNSFPKKEIAELFSEVVTKHGDQALQYGTTEGLPLLRELIADRVNSQGISATKENILITGGSQQGLDLVSKILFDPGDHIICGEPSYLGGLNSFRAFEARMHTVPVGDEGMDIDMLEAKLEQLHDQKIKVKFIYVIPTFQNPAGVTMPLEKRKRLLELASAYDTLVVEDNPYSELRFEGKDVPNIKTMDEEGRVIYMATFSKTLSPGFRLAYIVAPEALLRKLCIAKQSVDLCSTTVTQYVAAEFFQRDMLDKHIKKIIKMYKEKRDLMLKALDKYFPKEATYTRPEGGMFCWVTLPDKIDTKAMFPKAIEAKIAYITGTAFYANGGGNNTMRLNFTHAGNDQIEEGIKRLAKVIRDQL